MFRDYKDLVMEIFNGIFYPFLSEFFTVLHTTRSHLTYNYNLKLLLFNFMNVKSLNLEKYFCDETFHENNCHFSNVGLAFAHKVR